LIDEKKPRVATNGIAQGLSGAEPKQTTASVAVLPPNKRID
jgi:hypothetical protein